MQTEERSWWSVFPTPERTAPVYAKDNLLRQFNILHDILNAGTLLIDVRRNDYEGGCIRGSLNLPAQSFYQNMATLYRLCEGDGHTIISRVMFYCGSSNGRAPRCAGWFADYVAQRAAAAGHASFESPEVYTLEGGIKGWVAGGPAYTAFVDGFVPEYWKQFDEIKAPGKRGAEESSEAIQVAEDLTVEDDDSPTKRRRDQDGMQF